jgi:hypothetical protein
VTLSVTAQIELARDSQGVGAGQQTEAGTMKNNFEPGTIIQHYGVYRCSCGDHEFFGVSGRVFPRVHCPSGNWEMKHRSREEKFF